jgi:hypothetical protein
MQQQEPEQEPEGEKTTEACISEFNEYSGNLLYFNLPIISPSRSTKKKAYTLRDCGASHKFVNPEVVDRVCDRETTIKSRRRSVMLLTMAGQTNRLPLNDV